MSCVLCSATKETHTHTVTHSKRDATIRGMLTMKPHRVSSIALEACSTRYRPAQPALGLCECFYYLTFALSNNAYILLPRSLLPLLLLVASLVQLLTGAELTGLGALPAGFMCQFDCSLC